MTDVDLLALIKVDATRKALADAGQDNALADEINTSLPKPIAVTVAALQKAAPQTLAAVAAGANPLSEMDVIAARIRAGDAAGIGQWADTLALVGRMPAGEHTAVGALVTAALAGDSVTHEQVSRVLNAIRPRGHYQADGSFVADPTGPVVARPIAW